MIQAGDLVYHIDDARDFPRPPPGLVINVYITDGYEEAIVYFTDRTFSEYHKTEELIKVEECIGEYYDDR